MNDTSLITLNTVIRRNDSKFLANKLGEEMVMMDMENGNFISVNAVGADIWALCEQPRPVRDIIQDLLQMYDIAEEACVNETLGFLNQGTAEKLFTFGNSDSL